jgi:hypothetical protein
VREADDTHPVRKLQSALMAIILVYCASLCCMRYAEQLQCVVALYCALFFSLSLILTAPPSDCKHVI